MTEHTSLDIKFDLLYSIWYPRHWAARGVLHAESILHSHMVGRTAGIEFATFWSEVKSATRCFSYKEIWKRSCPWPMLEMNNLPRHFFYQPPPPSGLNGRPQSTLYIGALILERSFAEFGILHHAPCIWVDIFIPPFTVNGNGHWWMKNIWPKFRKKKICFWHVQTPPPPPSIRWLLIT